MKWWENECDIVTVLEHESVIPRGQKLFLAEKSEIQIFAIWLVWKGQTLFWKKGMY